MEMRNDIQLQKQLMNKIGKKKEMERKKKKEKKDKMDLNTINVMEDTNQEKIQKNGKFVWLMKLKEQIQSIQMLKKSIINIENISFMIIHMICTIGKRHVLEQKIKINYT